MIQFCCFLLFGTCQDSADEKPIEEALPKAPLFSIPCTRHEIECENRFLPARQVDKYLFSHSINLRNSGRVPDTRGRQQFQSTRGHRDANMGQILPYDYSLYIQND